MTEPITWVFSNDDVGGGGEVNVRWFNETCEYIEGHGIRATFFWIPKPGGKPSTENKGWMEALYRAKDRGHDIQLHGLTHHSLEFGLPPNARPGGNSSVWEEFQKDPARWQAEHAYDAVRRKLEEAIELYRRAFGEKPLIFRAPWLGLNENTLRAVRDLGIPADSSMTMNLRTWNFTVTLDDSDLSWERIPPCPVRLSWGILEFPCPCDFTHRGWPADQYDRVLKIAKREYKKQIEGCRGLAVLICHCHSMHKSARGNDFADARRFYDEIFAFLRENGGVRWATFREVVPQYALKL